MPLDSSIITKLKNTRFSLASEKDVQWQIKQVLDAMPGIDYTREYALDKNSIIDFLIGTSGIEVKIKGGKKAIYKQLERYAQFDVITELYLITSKSMGMLREINGKPVYVINISKAWL